MQTPPHLKKGDTIGLTCTARSITESELQPVVEIIQSWGYKVKLGSNIGLVNHQFAGTDQERANSLQALMDDDEVQAIWICRGGYGTVRIMDLLDFSSLKKQPKWLIGFSDITILHSHLNDYLKIASIHATMPSFFKFNNRTCIDTINDVLTGKTLTYDFDAHPLNRNGQTEGEIVGGNLSLLYSMLGTKTDIDTKDKILFIEDLDEYLYHIDRMIISLKRADKLTHLKALVVGGMSDMNDNDTPFGKNVEEIIYEHVGEYDYPICFNFPAGHIEDCRAVVLGKKCTVKVESNKTTFVQ